LAAAEQTLKISPPGATRAISPQPEPPPKELYVAELVFPEGQQVVSRYFPVWQVTVNRQTIGVTQQQQIFTRMPQLQPSIPAAAAMPQGLALDDKHFWLFDEKTGELKSVDKRSGAPVKSFKPDVKQVSAAAFGGGNVWLADQAAMKITAINPQTGAITRSLPLNYPKEKGFNQVSGMAWDGDNLWMAIAAGFSSSINQIDPATGDIKRSVFAECDPRGIAIRDGALYTVC
jgi:streptogramin lyase